MDDRLYTAEDHRFATGYEVQSRTRDELMRMPHLAGDDLQVLCDELAGHILKQATKPIQILVFAPGGTAAFLARYIESFPQPVRSVLWIEPSYDSLRLRAELLQLGTADLIPQGAGFAGSPALSCVVLAPTSNVLGWMDVMRRTIPDSGFSFLAYDPERMLRNYSPDGTYAYAVSRIWCGR